MRCGRGERDSPLTNHVRTAQVWDMTQQDAADLSYGNSVSGSSAALRALLSRAPARPGGHVARSL